VDKKNTEDILRRDKEKMGILFRTVPSALMTVDKEKRITGWNDRAAEITGYTKEDILGKSCMNFAVSPCSISCALFSDDVKKPLIGEESVIMTKTGKVKIISRNANYLYDEDGVVIGGIESFEDITDHKKSESDLVYYQNQLKDMVNKKTEELKDYQENLEYLVQARTTELRETNEKLRQEIAERKEAQERLRKAYTELKNTQNKLVESEKLAVIGRFTAGITHEVKNPLGVILGGIEYLIAAMKDADENAKTVMHKIKESTLRAKNTIQTFLKVARPSALELERTNTKELMNETVSSLQYGVPVEGVDVKVNQPEGDLYVDVDKKQIHQVLFNFCKNACEAMPDGGLLELNTYKARQEEFSADVPCCVLEIKDTGEGISPENLKRLFEPFFTTKRGEKGGTGLGLFMSKSIIDSHRGKFLIDSELGKGTRMRILLPLADDKET